MTTAALALSTARCPVCGTGFEGEGVVPGVRRDCPRCATPHHADCWDWSGGCGVFACTVEPGRSGAELVEFERTRARIQLWHRLFKVEWFALVALMLPFTAPIWGLPLVPLFFLLELVSRSAAQTLAFVVFGFWSLSFWLVPLGALVFLGAALPAWGLERWIGSRLGRPLRPPKGAPKALADRLGSFGEETVWTRVGRALLSIYALAVAGGALVAALAEGPTAGLMVIMFATVYAIPAMVVANGFRRRAQIEASIQNRLLASGKG